MGVGCPGLADPLGHGRWVSLRWPWQGLGLAAELGRAEVVSWSECGSGEAMVRPHCRGDPAPRTRPPGVLGEAPVLHHGDGSHRGQTPIWQNASSMPRMGKPMRPARAGTVGSTPGPAAAGGHVGPEPKAALAMSEEVKSVQTSSGSPLLASPSPGPCPRPRPRLQGSWLWLSPGVSSLGPWEQVPSQSSETTPIRGPPGWSTVNTRLTRKCLG